MMTDRLISRPARGAMPIMLAILALTGKYDFIPLLTAAFLASQIISLCASEALYIASGRILNDRKLRGNFVAALLLSILGAAGAVYLSARLIPTADIHISIAGALLSVTNLFSSRTYTQNRKIAAIADVCSLGFMLAGILISRGADMWVVSIGALSALTVACVMDILVTGARLPRFSLMIFRFIPAAIFRSWLCPALVLAVAYIYSNGFRFADDVFYITPYAMAVCLGCMAISIIGMPINRRSAGESTVFELVIIALSAASVVTCAVTRAPFFVYLMCQMCLTAVFVLVSGSQLPLKTCVSLAICALATLAAEETSVGVIGIFDKLSGTVKTIISWISAAAALGALAIMLTELPLIIRRARGLRRMRK